MTTYLVTGTARGIGLDLIRQLMESPEPQASQVFALTRSEPTPALQELIDRSDGRVINVITSTTDGEGVERVAQVVASHLGTRGLDVLINNAALGGLTPGGRAMGMKPEQMQCLFETNVVGTHNMISVFMPLLRRGNQKKVINISSQLGSIGRAGDFAMIPVHAYKISKAALHMLNKQYAIEHANEGFTFLCVSPGHLKTDMVGGRGDFEVDVGVRSVLQHVLKATPEQNGHFVNIEVEGWEKAFPGRYDGGDLPW